MTHFIPQPDKNGLVKLGGRITGLKARRECASFVFTASDQWLSRSAFSSSQQTSPDQQTEEIPLKRAFA